MLITYGQSHLKVCFISRLDVSALIINRRTFCDRCRLIKNNFFALPFVIDDVAKRSGVWAVQQQSDFPQGYNERQELARREM